MDKHRIQQLLHALNAKQVGTRTGWVTASCLFAPWLHHSGQDRSPSFGIAVNEQGLSHCSCFSCGVSHDVYEMVMQLRRYERDSPSGVQRDWARAIAIAADDEEEPADDDDEWVPYEQASKPTPPVFIEFPQFWLDSFTKLKSHHYLKDRGLPDKLVQELDVRFDFQRQRVCFPYRDFQGRLAGMQGRDVTGDNPLRYLSYLYEGRQNQQVWMGEHLVDFDRPVILTEGPIDYAKIRLVTENVLASLTSAVSANKLARLAYAHTLVTAYDFGTGGDRARAIVEKAFPHKLVLHRIPTEQVGDFGAMTSEQVAEALQEFL